MGTRGFEQTFFSISEWLADTPFLVGNGCEGPSFRIVALEDIRVEREEEEETDAEDVSGVEFECES